MVSVLLIQVLSSAVLADKPVGSTTKPTAKVPTGQDVLLRAWSAIYANNTKEALQFSDHVLKTGTPNERIEAAHCRARALLDGKDPAGKQAAMKIWNELASQKSAHAQLRAKIGQALVLSLDPKSADKAIEAFEAVSRESAHTTTALETSVELAELYIKAKRLDDAEKAMAQISALMGKDNLTRAELTESQARPFGAQLQNLKTKLTYARNAGLEGFEKAEGLRKDKKYLEAIAAYKAVQKEFPETQYGVRSEYSIGLCLMGLDKNLPAAEHFKTFIAAAPAGLWRGPAYVHLLDIQLEQFLDASSAAKYADMATEALKTAPTDEKIGPSWKPVLYDLHVRLGMVRFLQGKSEDAAVAFEEAKKLGRKEDSDSLANLATAIRAKHDVLPQDVLVPESRTKALDKSSVLLTLGVIYRISGNHEVPTKLYDRLLGDQTLRKTPQQESFAIFCKAISLLADTPKNRHKSIELLRNSITQCRDASFHDETLAILAILYDRLATKAEDRVKPVSTSAPALESRTEVGRSSLSFKKESQQSWEQLRRQHPASKRSEEALYGYARISYELAIEDSEAVDWKEINKRLKEFTDTFPKSIYAGDAFVLQVDIALERAHGLASISNLAEAMVLWADSLKTHKAKDDSPVSPWRMNDQKILLREHATIQHECYLRAAILTYLSGQYTKTREYAQKGGALPPPNSGMIFNETANIQKISLHFLSELAREQKDILDPEIQKLVKNDENLEMILRLADIYLWIVLPEKAIPLFEKVAEKKAPFSNAVPREVQSYCIAQLGLALDRVEGRENESLAWLEKLQDPAFKGTYWSGLGLYRAAVITFNNTQDPKKVIPLYERLISEYPDHPVVERACMYLCLNYLRIGKRSDALNVYSKMQKLFPKSDRLEFLARAIKDGTNDKKKETN